ncbi:MAG: antitoxin [Verrucomicrobia bacterium]|nr:antitoxin [Verrucomicrobiota bacterium]
MDIAKVFWSGRSQAVRLPKEFRFDSDQVRIRRRGNAIILEPLAHDWQWLDALAGRLDDDFVEAANEQPASEEDPGLDEFFGRK